MLGVFHRGDVVRKLREAQGWTQADLAKRAGLNAATVQRVEQNVPSVELGSIGRIAGALGVSVDYLSHASADVTLAVTHPAQGATSTEVSPMPESARAQLLALVQAIPEPEAAIVLPHVRQLLAQLWQRQQTQKK